MHASRYRCASRPSIAVAGRGTVLTMTLLSSADSRSTKPGSSRVTSASSRVAASSMTNGRPGSGGPNSATIGCPAPLRRFRRHRHVIFHGVEHLLGLVRLVLRFAVEHLAHAVG